MFFSQYESPVGPLTLRADGAALTGLAFGSCAEPPSFLPLFDESFAWLDAYFSGRDPGPTPPLHPAGTDFQRRVWAALRTIPYGETRTYGDIARQLGKPGAARAVGQANHFNPLPGIVPCHRVNGAKGSLVGYTGGLGRKIALQRLERGE